MTATLTSSQALLNGLRLSAEDRVLLAGARVSVTGDQVRRLASLCQADVDWQAVLDGAAWHKLEGLLHRNLGSPGISEHVPSEVRSALAERYRYHYVRQMFFRKELKDILDALRAKSIDVILLKGAALVDEVYSGDLGVRPMSDLDLLVRPEQAATADKTLRDMGFRSGVDSETEEQMRTVDRQLAALSRFGSPVVVEIHTHLVGTDSPIRFDISKIWDHGRTAQKTAQGAWLLKPEPLLATLAVNYLKDRRFYSYSALGQLCDVAEVLRKYDGFIDWDQFARGSMFSDLRGVMFGTLYTARGLLDAPVPDAVLDDLTPRDFRPEMADNLVRDRVLGREWLAKNISGTGDRRSRWSLPFRMVRRVFLSRHQFEYRRQSTGRASTGEYLLANCRRMWDATRMAGKLVVRPKRLYEDVSVDRWLTSLYRTTD